MATIQANGISLEYEDRGRSGDPVILLIMGLGRQMIAWPEALIDRLLAAQFRVILYDNRDVGRSTWIDVQPPALPAFLSSQQAGAPIPVPYTLTDMAEDALGLMDALSIAAAHVVGVSMGGMIAQILTATHPQRVLSLTSIMSSSGAPYLPGATSQVQARLFGGPPPGSTRDQAIDYAAETLRLIAYPDPQRDPSEFRADVERAAERGFNAAGYRRQLLAILADGSRVERLKTIRVRTLVIHGAADPLVPVACGIDTAKQISDAQLTILEEMAHDLPPSQVDKLASLLIEHARSSTTARAGA
jgi:pimeloyl-ACP methyl ester carboxylesterase